MSPSQKETLSKIGFGFFQSALAFSGALLGAYVFLDSRMDTMMEKIRDVEVLAVQIQASTDARLNAIEAAILAKLEKSG